MPEKELDLLKLAARIMAESRTRSPKICGARREMFMLAAVFLTTCQTVFSEMPYPHWFTRPTDTSE
jgi:hypothetical protein